MGVRRKISELYRKRFGRYEIEDPRPIYDKSPYTFFLPSDDRISSVELGDLVKIIFRGLPVSKEYGAERMWVKITSIHGSNLIGTLDNDPIDIPQLKCGDEVQFEFFHIIDYQWKNSDKEQQFKKEVSKQKWDRCLVDSCVIDRNIPVAFLYREKPDMTNEEDKHPDSGWRIRGDVAKMTDKEYENEKSEYIALGKVLNVDDSWLHLIDEPTGSRFFKNKETGRFEVDDE